MVMVQCFRIFSNPNRLRKLTTSFWCNMEGIKATYRSPAKNSTFVGLSPEKKLTNISIPTDRPFRVSIEGNIGAGKSTFIKYFQNFPGIETYPEPLEWWRNVNGHNLLDLMYSDINKWLKVFQTYVQLTRLKIQTSKPKNPNTNVQLFERSVQNSRNCFLQCALNGGFLHEADYVVIDEWYKWVESNIDINLDLIVYLRTSPEIVYERMKLRGRPEEMNIPLDYLKQLHDSHEKWLMSDNENINKTPVLVLDGNQTREDIMEQYRVNESKILGHHIRDWSNNDEKNKAKKILPLD